MNDDKLKLHVNSSGFPLQIALENLVNHSASSGGWKVLYKEHSWQNIYSNASGFIDLALVDGRNVSVMVIECKRVLNADWIFLLPSENQEQRHHIKVWISKHTGNDTNYFGWEDITASPVSPEAEFCVAPGRDDKGKLLLERHASELVEATESLANEEYNLFKSKINFTRLYFNVIVTTADLKMCRFHPDKISIETGLIDEAEFQSIPFIRFRKSLSTKPIEQLNLPEKSPYHLSRAKEHTVFIVNSSHFSEFTRSVELQNTLFRI